MMTWSALAVFFVAWLAYIAWREREKPLWARLVPLMTVLVSLLVLWGMVRYGDALLRSIRR
jgi:heme A synthase